MNSNLRKTYVIARQHFRNTVMTKAFLAATLLGPVFILAVSILPSLLIGDPMERAQESVIAVYYEGTSSAEAGQFVGRLETQLAAQGGVIEPQLISSPEEGREAVLESEVQAWVRVSEDKMNLEYYSLSETDYVLQSMLSSAVAALVYEEKLEQYNIPRDVAAELNARPALRAFTISESGEEGEAVGLDDRIYVVVTLTMLLYMTILFYGQIIGRSVVLEKTSKTIELMMSSVNSRQLMLGKIFGIGAAGIVQYSVWILITLLVGALADSLWGIGLPAILEPSVVVVLLLFFILGFLLYAAFYAAIGAASQDEQQVGQMGMPLILFLIVPMMMIAPITMDPGSTLAVALTFFPLTSPLVTVMRSVAGSVPFWQLGLSGGILALSIVLVGYFAARIFRTGILMTGKKASFKEMLRWMREA